MSKQPLGSRWRGGKGFTDSGQNRWRRSLRCQTTMGSWRGSWTTGCNTYPTTEDLGNIIRDQPFLQHVKHPMLQIGPQQSDCMTEAELALVQLSHRFRVREPIEPLRSHEELVECSYELVLIQHPLVQPRNITIAAPGSNTGYDNEPSRAQDTARQKHLHHHHRDHSSPLSPAVWGEYHP